MKDLPIYKISYNNYNNVLIGCSLGKEVEHLLFLSRFGNDYLAVDNEQGNCVCEDFSSLEKALCWLVRKDYSANEIRNLRLIEVRHLLNDSRYKVIEKDVIYGV